MTTTPLSMNTIRIAAERLIQEAQLHRVEYGSEDHPNVNDDILLVAPAAIAGLDQSADFERLRAGIQEAVTLLDFEANLGPSEHQAVLREVIRQLTEALG